MTVNAAMALLGALKVAVGETVAEQGDLRHPTVERTIEEILRVSCTCCPLRFRAKSDWYRDS